MGTAVAPADQVSHLLPASPAILLARRDGQSNVPLAYARVQALDASLQPIPGVTEARTDAGGRYSLAVPANHATVLRFSVGADEHRLDLLALARARADEGAQVVNADAASHVATKVILVRAGGIDAALEALGAPELQGAVDIIRRGLAGKIPQLASSEEVEAAVATQQTAAALTPVLAQVEKAAALASSIKPPPMLTSRAVAAAMPATAAVAAAPVPTPTPASSPTPQPAEAYKVEPQADTRVETAASVVAPRSEATTHRRRTHPEVDPYWAARERAQVRVEAFFPAPPRLPEARGLDPARAAAQQKSSAPAVSGAWVSKAPAARTEPTGAKVSPGTPAAGRKQATRPNGRLPLLAAIPETAAPSRRELPYESARPVAVEPQRKQGPLSRVVEFLARWLPRLRPPTGTLPG